MRWIKKGIIFVPDGQYLNMYSHAAIPFADFTNDNTLRIFFSSRNNKGQSLPFSIDVNPNKFNEIISLNSEPLFSLGELGTFDDNGIMPSCIVNIGNRKYLYYIGWNPQVTVSYRLSIGLAISDDSGKTFTKYSKGPICDRSIDEPYFNTAPFIIVEEKIWKMWYISCTGWLKVNNYPEPKYHIKYAESSDGIFWKKTGIVCIDYDELTEAIGRPSIILEDGVYRMWYSYRKITNYRTSKDCGYKIGYAESHDGKKWERKDYLVGIQTSKDGWDSEMIEYCHILEINGEKYMFYNGNGFGKTGFGYAVLEE